MKNRKLIAFCASITILAMATITAVIFMTSRPGSAPAQNSTEVEMTGTLACLPHKNAGTDQPQTLECAIGLKADSGKYYSLLNMPHGPASSDFHSHISVKGILSPPQPTETYDITGRINVKTLSIN